MEIDKLISGNKNFRKVKFEKYKDDFNILVKKGQKPSILFIGCSDSRVVPDMFLDSDPGDMFILRNVGNFVPPFKSDNDFHGSAAAIEYAVSVLKVEHIIVCGHSHCGACASLYEDIDDNVELVHVKKWLELGKKAKEYTLLAMEDKSDKEKLLRTTEKMSVLYQVENLFTYPAVEKRIKSKDIQLHAWYYKIEDGSIEYYDGDACEFKILGDD